MFIPEKNILLNGFVLSLSAPFHANNILLLVTHLLSKSNDPMPFRVIIIISINFSIKRTFHLTFDKIGYYILLKTFKPIVFWFFSIHCWINFSFILSCIFFLFVLCWHIFLYCFTYSFIFSMFSLGIFWNWFLLFLKYFLLQAMSFISYKSFFSLSLFSL